MRVEMRSGWSSQVMRASQHQRMMRIGGGDAGSEVEARPASGAEAEVQPSDPARAVEPSAVRNWRREKGAVENGSRFIGGTSEEDCERDIQVPER